MKTIVGLIVLVLTWSACSKDEALPDQEIIDFPTPKGFPEPEIPSYNLLTKAKIALGKKLFFDPILSRDNSISCNSCHKQSNAFADEQLALALIIKSDLEILNPCIILLGDLLFSEMAVLQTWNLRR
jgi:hypothetical protein